MKASPKKIQKVVDETRLLSELRELVQTARQRVATVANAAHSLLYWHIGHRLVSENLTDGKAEYGKRILATISRELTSEFGDGFTLRAIYRAIQFCQCFQDKSIVSTLSTQLGWSHFIEILPIKDPLAREFYAEMCRVERWSVQTLRKKISGMLYQRTALSKNTEVVIKNKLNTLRKGELTPEMVFRDPYFLDFLGLQGAYSEKDLEDAILREMEKFLLELGSGFSFVARQKRMSIGKDDFYLDLLFYHRHLRRLVAIELKLESFAAAHVGQMELYLRWLEKHEKADGELPPIGLILCASADAEQIELLQLVDKSIRVAEYLTELPPMKLLQRRLHQAIEIAKEQTARLVSKRKRLL
jgi:predicted nuclease of restriction endonuclease-like (RecB) superfamily